MMKRRVQKYCSRHNNFHNIVSNILNRRRIEVLCLNVRLSDRQERNDDEKKVKKRARTRRKVDRRASSFKRNRFLFTRLLTIAITIKSSNCINRMIAFNVANLDKNRSQILLSLILFSSQSKDYRAHSNKISKKSKIRQIWEIYNLDKFKKSNSIEMLARYRLRVTIMKYQVVR